MPGLLNTFVLGISVDSYQSQKFVYFSKKCAFGTVKKTSKEIRHMRIFFQKNKQTDFAKAIFTDHYTWQNFRL